jgi:uncharacterized protein (TIGR02186 family)
MKIFIIILLILLPSKTYSLPIIAELGSYDVSIDHKFKGLDLLVIGARNENGKIIIITRGDEKDFLLRKKERVFGIWLNNDSMKIYKAPSFYHIASSAKYFDNNENKLYKDLEIGTENLKFFKFENDYILKYINAFVEEKQKKLLYSKDLGKVKIIGETLFRQTIPFPKNIQPGNYTSEVYLVNGRELISMQIIPIKVEKIGFDARVEKFAKSNSYAYGLLAVLIANAFGFLAFKLFSRSK